MIENRNGFFDGLDELSVKQLKKHGGVSFISKKQRLEFELQRLNERQQKLELAVLKKQADLENVDNEEDGFRIKISAKDYELLQRAKQQQPVINPALPVAFQHQQQILGQQN